MSKVLVAVFSPGGATKAIAERLAAGIQADLFEIKPESPYTQDDLDWRVETSRCSREMNGEAPRPALESKVENLAEYDTVFVGFPIWWYREPALIDTFMAEHDFSGKTVVPFVTSGGSEPGDSGKNMQELAPGAKVEVGRRFNVNATEKGLAEWAAEWI